MSDMSRQDTYRFGYCWRIQGTPETVFHYVSDARTFLDWFPVFKDVLADEPVGPLHVGSHCVARVKAVLPYVLDWDITVSRYEPPTFIETAVKLSLNGRFGMHGYVRYRFEPQPSNVVQVINEQELAAERPVPRVLHGLAQLAFAFNHDWAMRQGAQPLQMIVRRHPAGATV
jgi:Polyketide cyclase / dehydrase and lipid transport